MTFWAKYDAEKRRGHLLVHHAADVAAVCEALLDLPIIRRRLARLGGRDELNSIAVARLCLLATLHDAGKFNHGFQRRVRGERNHAGHVGTVLALLEDRSALALQTRFLAAIGFDEISFWCDSDDGAVGLLIASFSHHGSPQPADNEIRQSIWQARGGVDPLQALEDFVGTVRGWYPDAFTGQGGQLPSAPAFQHAFNGLVTLADWIGSDDRIFGYDEQPDPARIETSRAIARDALRRIGFEATAAWETIRSEMPGFPRTFGHPVPRPLQRAVEEMPVPTGPSIAILEAETGSGKTEAAFRYFLRLVAAGRAEGMYFALPTRSAALQIHTRIREWTRNVWGATAPPVVLAVPGYLRVDDHDGRALPGFEVTWPDDDRERYRWRGWAAENPKRYMAGAILVGTIDQALLSALQARHADMRYAALLRHLIVVDEVHASDVYMREVLESLLHWHRRAGGDALLLSATLGSALRRKCLFPREETETETETASAGNKPYPLLSRRVLNAPAVEEYPIAHSGKQKKIGIATAEIADDPGQIAARAVAAARAGARVLVIRNLVDDAVRVQATVETAAGADADILFRCAGVAAPHHGRFAPADRKVLDEAVEEAFGKDSARRGRGVVLVATQTVEQSLDIDADYMITDLSPMDVLLQRLGRLHRHDRDRPPGFETARVCVLAPGAGLLESLIGKNKNPHGWGNVYEDLGCLEVTRRILLEKGEIEIPAMNRELVETALRWEKVLDPERWSEHTMQRIGRDIARQNEARLSAIQRDLSFVEKEIEFSLDDRSRTRLGVNARLVRLPVAVQGPFGCAVETLRIPGWMVAETNSDIEITDIQTQGGEIHFVCNGRRFCYGRYGLRKDAEPAD